MLASKVDLPAGITWIQSQTIAFENITPNPNGDVQNKQGLGVLRSKAGDLDTSRNTWVSRLGNYPDLVSVASLRVIRNCRERE